MLFGQITGFLLWTALIWSPTAVIGLRLGLPHQPPSGTPCNPSAASRCTPRSTTETSGSRTPTSANENIDATRSGHITGAQQHQQDGDIVVGVNKAAPVATPSGDNSETGISPESELLHLTESAMSRREMREHSSLARERVNSSENGSSMPIKMAAGRTSLHYTAMKQSTNPLSLHLPNGADKALRGRRANRDMIDNDDERLSTIRKQQVEVHRHQLTIRPLVQSTQSFRPKDPDNAKSSLRRRRFTNALRRATTKSAVEEIDLADIPDPHDSAPWRRLDRQRMPLFARLSTAMTSAHHQVSASKSGLHDRPTIGDREPDSPLEKQLLRVDRRGGIATSDKEDNDDYEDDYSVPEHHRWSTYFIGKRLSRNDGISEFDHDVIDNYGIAMSP